MPLQVGKEFLFKKPKSKLFWENESQISILGFSRGNPRSKTSNIESRKQDYNSNLRFDFEFGCQMYYCKITFNFKNNNQFFN